MRLEIWGDFLPKGLLGIEQAAQVESPSLGGWTGEVLGDIVVPALGYGWTQ